MKKAVPILALMGAAPCIADSRKVSELKTKMSAPNFSLKSQFSVSTFCFFLINSFLNNFMPTKIIRITTINATTGATIAKMGTAQKYKNIL